jgi:hypothetical protein
MGAPGTRPGRRIEIQDGLIRCVVPAGAVRILEIK